MAKIATITTQVEPALKQSVEAILSQVGLTTAEAITLFLKQVELQHGLPFQVKTPNAETRAALAEAGEPKKLARCRTPEDLYEDLDI